MINHGVAALSGFLAIKQNQSNLEVKKFGVCFPTHWSCVFVSAIFPPQLFKHGLLHGIARAFTVEEHERVRPGQTQGKRTVRVWVRLRAQNRLSHITALRRSRERWRFGEKNKTNKKQENETTTNKQTTTKAKIHEPL